MKRFALCLFVGVLTLGAAGCGGDEEVTPEASSRPLPEVLLSTISAAGALPADANRIDLVLDASGTLAVNGRVVDFADLSDALIDASGGRPEKVKRTRLTDVLVEELEETTGDRPLAPTPGPPPEQEELDALLPDDEEIVVEEPIIRDDDSVGVSDRGPEPPSNEEVLFGLYTNGPFEDDGSRGANLVLWVAPTVPWAAVEKVLMTAAKPEVMLYRTFFAVTSKASGRPRAVAVFLPKDRGLCGDPGAEIIGTLHVKMVPDGMPSNAHTIGMVIRSEIASEGALQSVSLYAFPMAPIQRVLDVVDGALQGGAAGFTFRGGVPLDASIKECVANARNESRTFGVKVADTLVAGSATGDERADWPEVFGFANAGMVVEDEILEEVILEETPDRGG